MKIYCLLLIHFSLGLIGTGSADKVKSYVGVNTGQCKYAKEVELRFLCKGAVTEDLFLRWHDMRVAVNVPYGLWMSGQTDLGEPVILVSFYPSNLQQYKILNLEVNTKTLMGKMRQSDEFTKVLLQHSEIHCLNHTLRYLNNLRSECKGYEYNQDERPIKYAILHYADLKVYTIIGGSGAAVSHVSLTVLWLGLLTGLSISIGSLINL